MDIPYIITCSSLTNLTVSSPVMRRTSRCVAKYMLEAAASSAGIVRIVCDDTDVFVLLVHRIWRKGIRKDIQMEKWDGTVLDIRSTVGKLEDKCGQLPGMHAMSDYDTVSYPSGKSTKSALKILVNNDIDVLREPAISQGQLKATAGTFFPTRYPQKNTDSLNTARYKMYMSRKKPPPLKKLPPRDSNLQLHVLRAHLQMMLWKAADQMHPPFDARDTRRFCWDVKEGGGVTSPVSNAPVAIYGLLDVVSCGCSAERKTFSEKRCSCHSADFPVLLLRRGHACCRPFNKHTEENELAEYIQEGEREADDDE